MKTINYRKAVYILYIICLFYVLEVNSQTSIGIKFGTNLSGISNHKADEGFKTIINRGNIFGITSDFPIKSNFSVQTDFLFSGKGYAQKEITGEYYEKFNMNYIELPLMLKYKFGSTGSKTKYYLSFGYYASYWIDGYSLNKEANNLNTQDHNFIEDYDPNINTLIKDRRLDMGICLGTGIIYAFGNGNIIVNAIYGKGLSGISTYRGITPDNWSHQSNQSLSLTAGYLLYISK